MLNIEDGSGVPNADSYVTVAFADNYVTNYHGVASSWFALDEGTKEIWLRRAAKYLDQHYLYRWKGDTLTGTQALQWPRIDAVTNSGWDIASNEIPEALQQSQVEAALRLNQNETAVQPDLDRGGAVKSEKVDVIQVVYMDGAATRTKFTQIDELIGNLVDPPTKMVRA